MTSYFRSGKFTPLQTGLLVWKDFITPILTTTLTTVFAFLPMLISTGIIGEFIKSIPIVVSSTLIASFFVAMVITLPLTIILLKPQFPRRVVLLFKIVLLVFLLGILVSVLPKGPLLPVGLLAAAIFLFVTANIRMIALKRTKQYVTTTQKNHKLVRTAPHYIENGLISFHTISEAYKKIITRILQSKSNRRKAIAMVIIFSIFLISLCRLASYRTSSSLKVTKTLLL